MSHRRHISSMASIAVALTLFSAVHLLASSDHQVSIPERMRGAKLVVVATARTVTPRWHQNAYGDQLIVSEILLEVEEALKGSPSHAVLVDLEGGSLGGLTLHVSDLPSIQPGERAVFLLDSSSTGAFVPHRRGLGIMKLDQRNMIRGSQIHLDEVRRAAGRLTR